MKKLIGLVVLAGFVPVLLSGCSATSEAAVCKKALDADAALLKTASTSQPDETYFSTVEDFSKNLIALADSLPDKHSKIADSMRTFGIDWGLWAKAMRIPDKKMSDAAFADIQANSSWMTDCQELVK